MVSAAGSKKDAGTFILKAMLNNGKLNLTQERKEEGIQKEEKGTQNNKKLKWVSINIKMIAKTQEKNKVVEIGHKEVFDYEGRKAIWKYKK